MERSAAVKKGPVTGYYAPVFLIGLTAIGISFCTRLLLLIKTGNGIPWTFSNITGIVAIGLLYDLVIASFLIIPLILHLWLTNDASYARNRRWFVAAGWTVLLAIILFTQLVPKDFNEDLRKAVIVYLVCRLVIFLLLSFASQYFRDRWRKAILLLDFFIITYLLLFNAVSEWFFWDEFATRYNFIAVDYLVYTTEVIGNIRESYPIVWIMLSVFLLTISLVWWLRRPVTRSVGLRPVFWKRSLAAIGLLLLPVTGYFLVNDKLRAFSGNEYANELAGNGLFTLASAFTHNELDFSKFYTNLSDRKAFSILREALSSPNSHFVSDDVFNIERTITSQEPEKKMNVVLISVESLSASFMQAFGNTQHITPVLDSLARQSLFFTRLYASGTRTVRGLEALSLSIPPTPGQSIVKRPGNEGLFSLGAVFKSKGYNTQYIYGGYGYFDNMNYFFSHNNYEVIDRTALAPEQVHYANIWGVADEDLFTLALQQLDSDYAKGKPFFSHIMTVSNHRPFTYPDGRIDIPPAQQAREGAVKYTDYSIGQFIQQAARKPWYHNTVFVIVADHCAGSAGSVQLPLNGYHIPLLIYSPGNIEPQKIDKLTAQIDIAPTLLGLLHFQYRSKFFGQDIFSVPAWRERAFISTYQGLGFFKHDRLIIQSPVKKLSEFIPDETTGNAQPVPLTDSLANQAIAWYQCASWLFKHGKYRK